MLVGVPAAATARAAEPAAAAALSITWRTQSLKTVYDPGRRFYCYAPSVVVDEDGTEHIFACRNREAGVIRDHIYHFVRARNGRISEPAAVLFPGPPGAWDSFHVCDPSVVAGQFHFGGASYRWAMFYLGNDVDACRHNQIGVAFANDLAGPWRRRETPIVAYPPGSDWGAGQPSAVSLDRAGKVLLFYTASGNPSAWMRELDLSDADHAATGDAVAVPTGGLTNSKGGDDRLNNFDVALDTARDRFVIVREQHPYPRAEPHFISRQLQIASIDAADLRRGTGTWHVDGTIGPDLTGFPRNHNAGFARTAYGALPRAGSLCVVFASSQTEPELHGLFAPWTYALHEITGEFAPAGGATTRPAGIAASDLEEVTPRQP